MKLKLYAKCNDLASLTIIDDNGKELYDEDGSLPLFIGGDEIQFEINPNTGKILNWDKEGFKKFFKEKCPTKKEATKKRANYKKERESLKTYDDYLNYFYKHDDGTDKFYGSQHDIEIPAKVEIQHYIDNNLFCSRVSEFLSTGEVSEYCRINNVRNSYTKSLLIKEDSLMVEKKIEELSNILKEEYSEKVAQSNDNYSGEYKTLIKHCGVYNHVYKFPVYRFYNILNLLLSKGFINLKPEPTIFGILIESDSFKDAQQVLFDNKVIDKNGNLLDNFLLHKLKTVRYTTSTVSEYNAINVDNSYIIEKLGDWVKV